MSRRDAVTKKPHQGRHCGDCYWLFNAFEGQTCRDVGQDEDSEACPGFEYRKPNEWIRDSEPVAALSEALRKRHLRVPKAVRVEIEDTVKTVGDLDVPRVVKTPAQGRKLQTAVAATVAYRSRATELLIQLASLRVGLISQRAATETELLVLGPVRALKTKHERDIILAVGCEEVDRRIAKVGALMDACREVMKTCDATRNASDIILRAIYATKDPS